MLHRCLLGLLLAMATTSATLMAGCKSVSQRITEVQDDRETQRLAAAHAHYASGVLHDLNDEAVLALDDYFQAAMLDSDDEELVLEVTRRFLANKQPDKALEILTRAVNRPDASGLLYGRLATVYTQLGQTDLAINASRMALKKAPQELVGYQNLSSIYLQNKQLTKAFEVLNQAAKTAGVEAEFLVGLGELYLNFGLQAADQRTNANAKADAVFIRAQKMKPDDSAMQLRLAEDFNLVSDWPHAAKLYQELLKNPALEADFHQGLRARLADIYMREQDQQHALEQLQALAKSDPANPQINYYLGSLAFDAGQMTNAADYFSKTILLQPGMEAAYYDLASAQINLDQPLNALSTLARARDRFSENFLVEYLSGVIYMQQTNYIEALKCFTTAEIVGEAKQPQRLTADFYFQIGATCERLNKISEAQAYFEKSLKLRPNDAETMNYFGFMLADHDLELERARDLIAAALKVEPDSAAYLDSMGWVLFKLGKLQPALDYLLKANAASEKPDAELLNHLGDVYAALNQMNKARAAWRQSVQLEPNDAVQKKLAPATGK